MRGITGTNLLMLLELRLDNVVYRLGFAPSRNEARQLVRHNHFLVNGEKVNIPSYKVRKDDVLEAERKEQKGPPPSSTPGDGDPQGHPGVAGTGQGQLQKVSWKAIPTREDITMPVQEQLVVELYSK